MNETLLTEYAQLCETIQALEEKKKEINSKVLAHMAELKADRIQAPFGTFSINNRTSWKYTTEVDCAREEMEAIMEEEKKNGLAKSETIQFLRFQSLKTK